MIPANQTVERVTVPACVVQPGDRIPYDPISPPSAHDDTVVTVYPQRDFGRLYVVINCKRSYQRLAMDEPVVIRP